MMKVSVSLYISTVLTGKRDTLVKYFSHENIFKKDIYPNTLASLRSAGCDGIELVITTRTSIRDIQKVKKILYHAGLKVFSIHQPLSKIFHLHIEDIEKLFLFAKELHVSTIVIHMLAVSRYIHDQIFIARLKKLEKFYGVLIGFENVTRSPLSRGKKYCWEEEAFTSLTAKNNLYITFDTAHVAQSKGNIVSFFRKNKKRIINIHLSDYKAGVFHREHRPLGNGDLQIATFISQLEKEKYNGFMTLEIMSDMSNILNSIRFVHEQEKNTEISTQ